MVPERSLVMTVLTLILLLGLASIAEAQSPTGEVQLPAAPEKTEAPTPIPVPIEERPYRIRAFVAFDPSTRIDARWRDRILDDWRALAARFVGPAWMIEAVESEGPAAGLSLDEISAADLKPLSEGADKVWLIRGRVGEAGFRLRGCELDVATGYFGSIHSRPVPFPRDVARELFRLSEQIFAPSAEIGEARADVVPLRVQGMSLSPGRSGDAIAPVGAIFRPIRVIYKDDGTIQSTQKILFSYLRVVARNGPIADCSLIRGVRDPLSRRYAKKNRLIALGIKPAAMPTRLRFVEQKGKDERPAAGYVLTARPVPQGVARDVATTDREGRVTLPPGFDDGLVILRLIAGKAEPMLEVPIMPGEGDHELTIPFEPRPLTIALESKLDALRDDIIDLVASRSRLERRMKAREQGDDWAGVAAALDEFRKLPPRDAFAKRLQTLEEGAQAQEAQTKSLVLTRNARSHLVDTKALLDRYLDDEVYRAYEDALLRSKDRDAQAKAQKAKPKPAPRPVPAQPQQRADDASKKAPQAVPKPPPAGVTPF